MVAGVPALPAFLARQYDFPRRLVPLGGGGDYSIHCIDTGGPGRPVLLLHGNPTWSFFYRGLVAELRRDFRCVAPDHLGCGLSSKPQDWPYRLEGHMANLERVVAALGLAECDLVVHDWGGAIGMGLAGRKPEWVRRIVILNTAAFRSRHLPRRIALCRTPLLGTPLVRGLNAFAWPATFMAVTRALAPEVRQGYLWPYRTWRDRVAIDGFVRDIPLEEDHPSYDTLVEVEEGLARLRDKPMLIYWGGRDFCFTERFYRQWQKRFPAAQARWIADAGHYVLEDARGRAEREIAAFLRAEG